nr:Ribosomal protein L32 [Pedinophyceae sp. YPF-701]
MAVPKKRMSKSKTNKRKFVWKKQANTQAKQAISKAKSMLKELLAEQEATS